MLLTRSDDLSELLELLGADLDLADFKKASEKLDGHCGQHWALEYCVDVSRRSHAIVDMLHTFASVSAFQTIGMVLMEEDGDRVNSVEEEVMVGVGLESRVSWCGLGETEFVLVERLRWAGVGGNGKDMKSGGGETLEPGDAHGCLTATGVGDK